MTLEKRSETYLCLVKEACQMYHIQKELDLWKIWFSFLKLFLVSKLQKGPNYNQFRIQPAQNSRPKMLDFGVHSSQIWVLETNIKTNLVFLNWLWILVYDFSKPRKISQRTSSKSYMDSWRFFTALNLSSSIFFPID